MPTSPELAGGSGFTFEGAVAAYYLTALLAEGHAPGVANRVVTRVALQQRDFGHPLDDVIVDLAGPDGGPATLSLQCKRKLVISDARTNADFREVVRDAWATLTLPSFREGVDRFGAAVGEVAMGPSRAMRSLCEAARVSPKLADFDARLSATGNANDAMAKVHQAVSSVLRAASGGTTSPGDVHRFLAHFVLLEFDFLHEGAVDPPEAVDRLTPCLAASDAANAPLLWSHLQALARDGAGQSAIFDRPSLVTAVAGVVRLSAASSLRSDLDALRTLAGAYAEAIPREVGGVHIDRPGLSAELDQVLTMSRLVQVRGLAGSGKSVMLRSLVERAVDAGPLLFLKADQLEGKSWRSFATHQGLSAAPLRSLLAEIGATGTATLFIDAIDRVEIAQQPIVAEAIRLIALDSALSDWRVVATVRDGGAEMLRNWLGDALDSLGVATVPVRPLDDDEAGVLAGRLPQLRPLLFGPAAVREIARRPFFSKVLVQGSESMTGFQPSTEVDLADHWWDRGGYDSSGGAATMRQRAILELASVRARNPSGPIPLNALSHPAVDQVAGLVADGIVQWARLGHVLRFSHDIFFEWSFYHALEDAADWLVDVRGIGEPPAVARSVELLAQSRFAAGDGWRDALPALSTGEIRSQWMRSWLLGPIGSAAFAPHWERYWSVVAADDFRLLRKALIWFQAERTTPNPNVLAAQNLEPDQRQRAADLLGWPADWSAWMRLINFVDAVADSVPARLYPDMLEVFEVWQRAVGEVANSTSATIVALCDRWLKSIDAPERRRPVWREPLETEAPAEPNSAAEAADARWKDVPEVSEFRSGLIRLILTAAPAYPEPAHVYLERMLTDQEQLDRDAGLILAASPALSRVHPVLLADVTFKHLRDDLPDEVIARDRERNRSAAVAREAALAKSEAERTRIDQAAIDGAFFTLGSSVPSVNDWTTLSLERDIENFSPVSPLREPFPSLLANAPDEGLRLIRAVSAHALEAWRQLHRLDRRDGTATPVPLNVVFPWGDQIFWGGPREYMWHRALLAPNPLGCAFLALENWALAELGNGADPDELIRKVLDGNECVAALGTAVTIALQSDLISPVGFALLTSQRLLIADRHRARQERTIGFAGDFGANRAAERPHAAAVSEINERPVRGKVLTNLAPLFLFGSNGNAASRLVEAFAKFPNDLPFLFEEQRDDPETIAGLTEQARTMAEIADAGTYRGYRTEVPDEVLVVHEAPSANTPEAELRREEARAHLAEQTLWSSAIAALDGGIGPERAEFDGRLALARSLDVRGLYGPDGEDEGGVRRGGVAGTAATAIRFPDGLDAATLEWARGVLHRVVANVSDDPMARTYGAGPWHEAVFAVRGLAADVRAGGGEAARTALLALVAHPLDAVAALAVREAMSLWDADPRLGWAALHLGLALCKLPPRRWNARTGDFTPSADRAGPLRAETLRIYLGGGWPDLPQPPPAWVELTEREARERSYHRDSRDEYDAVDPARMWTHPEESWHSQRAGELLKAIPLATVLASDAREPLLRGLAGYLDWTIARNVAPWKKPGRRDKADSNLFEWTHELGGVLGALWTHLDVAAERGRFLDPILAAEGDGCWSLLAPLAEAYVCRAVYDAPVVPPDAQDLLSACTDRLLASRELDREGYRSGRFSGFDQPRLARTLMFVSVERANGAARFVNGDWSEIAFLLPLVDRIVRAAGWAPSVMGSFLTLCERARDAYPSDRFAEQVIEVLGPGDGTPAGWTGTLLTARIAGLVQHFSNRDTPMPTTLARALLRLLDRLVDTGDRRSAALQLSEAFREVRVEPVPA